MSLIPYVRQQVITKLWQRYIDECDDAKKIIAALKGSTIALDHLAIIDLPSKNTGISTLNQIFAALDYLPQGRDYLEDKQNEFMWLAPRESESQKAIDALPQIVIADFCLEALPPPIQEIIHHYANEAPAFPWRQFHTLCGQSYRDNKTASETLIQIIVDYCLRRDWSLPSESDYETVKKYNELIAWVLRAGRKVNHFGLQIHHLPQFLDLLSFNHFIENNLGILLNDSGGRIKGNKQTGIMQSSTQSDNEKPFMEFVWRFSNKENPENWKDYFTGFIGAQANHVIESVY